MKFPSYILWGMTGWSLLHMAGGGIFIKGVKLYATMLITLVGEPYNILKYDQFVHAYGFAIATMIVFALLKPSLSRLGTRNIPIIIVLLAGGLGFGALNEIIEFFAVVIAPSTGVGGYYNTALDLVFNAIGSGMAVVFIYFKELKVR